MVKCPTCGEQLLELLNGEGIEAIGRQIMVCFTCNKIVEDENQRPNRSRKDASKGPRDRHRTRRG